MTNQLFIDTWGWLTLSNNRESCHQEAVIIYQQCLRENWILYTTDYVLDETYTLMFKRFDPSIAKQTMDLLIVSLNGPRFRLEWITPERFKKTQEWRERYMDKPRISFTDLTSMVVMAELGIRHVLSGDEHFEHVGLGFQRVP